MKKITAGLMVLFYMIVFAIQPAGAEADGAALRQVIDALQTNRVLAVYEADYDKDGIKEAFVLTGEVQEGHFGLHYRAELWFVGGNEAYKIEETKSYKTDVAITRFGGQDFLVLTEEYASETVVDLWGVRDAKPYQAPVSGRGGDFDRQSDTDFSLTDSAYDASEDSGIKNGKPYQMRLGHTRKRYYFYWDEKEQRFHEYGGLPVTEEQLLRCEGAKVILDEIKEDGCQIDAIFYRGNHIIHINYSSAYVEDEMQSRSFHNATLRLQETEVQLLAMDGAGYEKRLLDSSNQFGVYAAAMIPEIAVYPEALPAVFLTPNEETSSPEVHDGEETLEENKIAWQTYALTMTAAGAFLLALSIVFILIACRKKPCQPHEKRKEKDDVA